MKVFIVSASFAYNVLFDRLGHTLVDDLSKAELVVFTGGEDVSPGYYDAKPHAKTFSNAYRDAKEAGIFSAAKERGIPMVGICRGGQFLNVMSGGAMYQHVDKHCGNHNITDLHTGETVLVSSTHHQMMKPSESAIIIATADLGGSREWFEGSIAKKDISKEDIEVVFYPETQALCFQPHPEFNGVEYSGMYEYFKKCLERFVYIDVEVA